ncbi:hypothetical protein RSAG8_05935, partial [Rhizoctonia solani AG-8 WAC10335]
MKHIAFIVAILATGLQLVLALPTPLAVKLNNLEKHCQAKGESCMNIPYPLPCCTGNCNASYGQGIH